MAPDTDTNPELSLDQGVVRQWNSIGFKIMLANMIALLVLGLGIVMFSEYRRAVVYTELSLLEDEARLWAMYLSEDSQGGRDLAHRLDQLVAMAPRGATVFDAQGRVRAERQEDSAHIQTPSRLAMERPNTILTEPLARFLLMLFPVRYDLPLYQGGGGATIDDYPVVMADKSRGTDLNAWVNAKDELIFTATVPVVLAGGEIGTLLLMKATTETDEAFQMARFDIVRILMAALAITLALTLYVAFMIARPLNRLARAARDVGSKGGEIPDLSARGDEIGALSLVLRQTTRALRARLNAIERFAADVAHELKNPLTSLRSAIETLPRLQDEQKRAQLMSIMSEDTQRLDRLITDISRLSRLDSELAREQTQPIDLRQVMAQVARGITPPETFFVDDFPRLVKTEPQGVILRLLVPEGLPRVMGHPGRLEQVFGNVVGNALSFSSPEGEVRLEASVRDSGVRVVVEDEGPGIPAGKLDTIFTRFYSERPTGEEFGIHSGLGLAIARQIVESVQGKIWAENRESPDGRILGARFVIELPVSV